MQSSFMVLLLPSAFLPPVSGQGAGHPAPGWKSAKVVVDAKKTKVLGQRTPLCLSREFPLLTSKDASMEITRITFALAMVLSADLAHANELEPSTTMDIRDQHEGLPASYVP